MDATQEWRQIPGYEGYYEVSNHGNIRSMTRWVTHPTGSQMLLNGRPIIPEISKAGYPRVRLCRESTQQRFLVHQLVLAVFVGPRPTGLVTRHLNDIKTDNRLENLRYGTVAENAADKSRNGGAFKARCTNGHEYTPENTIWRWCSRSGRYRVCRACQEVWRIGVYERRNKKRREDARKARQDDAVA